ncbi:MAG: glycosyltransferase family 2 protein [Bradymonadales bacterium]|nr:glycosyltransferase family 2 protein [Bradymonadales bacterium]
MAEDAQQPGGETTIPAGPAPDPDRRPSERSFGSLTVVIPTYNEAESLSTLHSELVAELEAVGVPFEIILVDDGSTDVTPRLASEICRKDQRVRYLRFRRNFGKAAALNEGFGRAQGEVVVTMDADLQDNPAEIHNLLDALDEGYDLISGWKWPRRDPLGKRLPSKLFNFAVRAGTGLALHDMNCGLKAYRKEMVDSLSIYGDMHRYIPVLAQARGFKVGEVKVSHRPRLYGKSKYSVGRFSRGFLDFLTVLFLTRYRTRPLHLIGGMGLAMGLIGALILLILTIGWFAGTPIGARPLFFMGILLTILAVQLITFGLMAEMVTSFFLVGHNQYPVLQEIGFDTDRPGVEKETAQREQAGTD